MDEKLLLDNFIIVHSTFDGNEFKCLKCGSNESYVRGILKGRTSSCYYSYPNFKLRKHKKCRNCYVKETKKIPAVKRFTPVFIKSCNVCVNVFVTKFKPSKYCSKSCAVKFAQTKRLKSYELKCEFCSKKFQHNRKSKFCSLDCSRKSTRVERTEKSCKKCNVTFMSTKKIEYCSDKCSPWRKSGPSEVKCVTCESKVFLPKKKCETCKSKHKVLKIYKKTCPHCSIDFETTTQSKIYCKPGHSAASIESGKLTKRLRKKKQSQRKLKVENWKDIAKFKSMRPKGKHLDHIIPLNHPDVCGLHNTWNFQWLEPEDNIFKSNKFDGTMENEAWKDIS